jgi:hypothetical protein
MRFQLGVVLLLKSGIPSRFLNKLKAGFHGIPWPAFKLSVSSP